MTEATIELAKHEDIPVLVRLMEEYYAYEELDFEERSALSALEGLLNNESWGRVWVVCLGGRSIGYVAITFGYSLEYGGQDAFIDELYIQRPYRRRGIGTEVLGAVDSTLRALGIKAVHLEVDCDNHAAQSFYRSQGYEVRDRFRLMSKHV